MLFGSVAALRSSIVLAPRYAEPLNGLGTLEVERDRPREALPYFERALTLSPGYHEVRLNRAIINGHVAGRNSLRQPSFFDLDVRLLKAFKLGDRRQMELIAEVFNVTRAKNLNFGVDGVGLFGTPAQPVATAGQPLFAPSTARFGGPRQVQLGMRVV